MVTIAQMTTEYNEYAAYLGLPAIKKLKKTKQGSPADRLSIIKAEYEVKKSEELAAQQLAEAKRLQEEQERIKFEEEELQRAREEAEKVTEKQRCLNGIKHTRKGTAAHVLFTALLEGGTIVELQNALEMEGSIWMRASVHGGIGDAKRKGYVIEKSGDEKDPIYRITNADIIF